MKTTAFFLAMLLTMFLSGVVSGQQKPTTGYARVNGLKMNCEIHGSGEPVGAAPRRIPPSNRLMVLRKLIKNTPPSSFAHTQLSSLTQKLGVTSESHEKALKAKQAM